MATFQIKAQADPTTTTTTRATTTTKSCALHCQPRRNYSKQQRQSCQSLETELKQRQHQKQHKEHQQRQHQRQSASAAPFALSSHRPQPRSATLTRLRCLLGWASSILRSPLRFGSKFNGSPTDSLFMMLTMLVVVTVVISGNTVFAAQRDSYKPKDGASGVLSNNANAIPNAISGTGNAVSSSGSHGGGNTNNVSNGNTNFNNAAGSNTSLTSSNQSAANGAATTATATSMSTTTITKTTTQLTTTTSTGSSSSGSSKSGGSGNNRNTIEVTDDSRNGPYFDRAASKNVTALLGKTAYLNCRVKNLGNKTMLLQVSWVRHRDIHLLTVGRYTYTSDQRFRAIHQPQTEDWILQIKYPQHRDSGIYECQVSTTPHMSHYIHLNVVEPSTEIIGAPDLYIESGSTINLTCVILNSPEPPAYIFWNHNNAIINYDSPRGGVSVVTNKGETTTSFLLIKSARPSDSGHYQCNPSNAKPKSVTVHVLNGEFPAAMQRAAPALHRMSPLLYLLAYLSICCCSWAFARRRCMPSRGCPVARN